MSSLPLVSFSSNIEEPSSNFADAPKGASSNFSEEPQKGPRESVGGLKEDPLGERPNNIQVRVETESGTSAQAGFTVFWDRTPPTLSALSWRLAPDRLMLEGSIGEAGTLLVAGFMVPLDPRGRVIPGFGIPYDRLNEGVNTVIATDRAGNRISVNWTVRKPRIPPPPPKR